MTVHTGDRSLVVSAAPRFRLIGRGDRTAEELANALRHARDAAATKDPRNGPVRSEASDPPDGLPVLDRPRAPAGLYLLWLGGTPVLAWLLQLFASV